MVNNRGRRRDPVVNPDRIAPSGKIPHCIQIPADIANAMRRKPQTRKVGGLSEYIVGLIVSDLEKNPIEEKTE